MGHSKYLKLLAATAIAAALAVPSTAIANEEPNNCEKKLGAKGFPNKIHSVASLNAIRVWVQMAEEKYGPDYSMWHNASKTSLKCEKLKNSDFIGCFAKGTPCKAAPKADKTAANNR